MTSRIFVEASVSGVRIVIRSQQPEPLNQQGSLNMKNINYPVYLYKLKIYFINLIDFYYQFVKYTMAITNKYRSI